MSLVIYMSFVRRRLQRFILTDDFDIYIYFHLYLSDREMETTEKEYKVYGVESMKFPAFCRDYFGIFCNKINTSKIYL